jgi:formate--tetrahydrofolate ligase
MISCPRERRILRIRAAGAGFIVLVCGDVMTMPDLPRHPAALDIGLGENEPVEGLV